MILSEILEIPRPFVHFFKPMTERIRCSQNDFFDLKSTQIALGRKLH